MRKVWEGFLQKVWSSNASQSPWEEGFALRKIIARVIAEIRENQVRVNQKRCATIIGSRDDRFNEWEFIRLLPSVYKQSQNQEGWWKQTQTDKRF